MRIYFINLLLTTTLFAGGIVKKDADLDTILNKIDAISQAIKQKEMQENHHPPVQEVKPVMSKDEELEQELMKEERELSLKERKLELSRKKQEYYKRYKQIQDRSRFYLIKKTNKLISSLKRELYGLKKSSTYKIPVDKFMKIGKNEYAYIPSSKLSNIQQQSASIKQKIENIKNTIKKLQNAKDLDSDTWFQTINSLDNQMQDEPKQLVEVMPSQPNMQVEQQHSQNNYIKVQIGDIFDNVIVKKVNEQEVVLTLKE